MCTPCGIVGDQRLDPACLPRLRSVRCSIDNIRNHTQATHARSGQQELWREHRVHRTVFLALPRPWPSSPTRWTNSRDDAWKSLFTSSAISDPRVVTQVFGWSLNPPQTAPLCSFSRSPRARPEHSRGIAHTSQRRGVPERPQSKAYHTQHPACLGTLARGRTRPLAQHGSDPLINPARSRPPSPEPRFPGSDTHIVAGCGESGSGIATCVGSPFLWWLCGKSCSGRGGVSGELVGAGWEF